MAFPATYKSIQDSVINKLRLDDTADRPKVKDWINQIYADACVETEALQKGDTMAVTPNTGSYTLPAAIIRMLQMTMASASAPTSYGAPLEQVTLEEILALRESAQVAVTNNGTPAKYAVVGIQEIELWPTPTAADTLLMYYSYLPTALSADGDTLVLPEPFGSKLIEYGTLAEAADYIGDADQDRYRALYENWLAKLRTHLNRRRGRGTGQFRIIGAPLVSVGRDIDLGR
jgi:hypothetical protein